MEKENSINQALYGQVLFKLLKMGIHSGIFAYLSYTEVGHFLTDIHNKFCEFDKHKLQRFLNACVAGGLLEYDRKGRFRVNRQHRKFYDLYSEQYIEPFINHMDGQTQNQLEDLEQIMRGMITRKLVFDKMYKNEESIRKFLNAMWGLGYADAYTIIRNKEFPNYRELADIGGGTGAFAIVGILEEKLEKASVFDLPEIQFYVDEKITEYQLDSKMKFISGNFFLDELPKADAYTLGYILSDWDDSKCRELLKKIYKEAPQGADVIILEKLFNKDKTTPFSTAMMDICMMVETGGKHRTYEEYKNLLDESGFSDVYLIKSEGEKHAIIGKKGL